MIRIILSASLLLGGSALAQMPMASAAPGTDTPATAANKAAMQRMMTGMDAPATGDADHDFVAGMLPHHQGAIDMAHVELRHGHDPALRKLARAIIASQAKERIFMKRWLAQHPAPQP